MEEKNLEFVPAKPIEAIFIEDDPEDKVYLLLLKYNLDFDEIPIDQDKDWQIKVGRQNTYDYLVNLLKVDAIDPNASFIVSGNVAEDASVLFDSRSITIFRFMKVMLENHKVIGNPEEFDIEVYAEGDFDKSILDI